MTAATSDHRVRLGFRDGDKGVHSSRTLMLAELEAALAATDAAAGVADFRRAIVEENVLGKRSATTREHTVRKLKALYGLDPAVPVYAAMRRIWSDDPRGHPLLALLCAVARDPLLRASVDKVLETPVGTAVTATDLEGTVRPSFSTSTRDAIVSHLLSTWTTAGFLAGSTTRRRVRPVATPGAVAYALALGFMEGGRGSLLLSTAWTRLLDCPPDELLNLARQAARRGWIEYRSAGDVMDLRVDGFFTEEQREWCDGR